jgi:serine/threonine protein kinase
MISASAGMPPPLLTKRRSSIVPVQADDSGNAGDFTDRFTETATRIRMSVPRCAPNDSDPQPTRRVTQGSAPLAPGCELGSFRLVEALGHGAQGDVWKARRLAAVEQLVALKVLKPSLARHPARMAQFRHEAERGLRLSGPSLLAASELKESHVESHHPFVSLDESGYLFAMVEVLAEAASALARVHERHIVHRDVKPANILVDNRCFGRVYLCDFGLGRDLEVATPEQMRDGSGTPMYMAPERLLMFTADEIKCDIYSMGVTLCEALTLERPFQVPEHVAASGLAPFLARAVPRRPCLLDPDFPEELEAIIMKAMARDPRQRHESARELARDLEQFLERGKLPSRLPPAAALSGLQFQRPHALVRRAVVDRGGDRGFHHDTVS